MMTETWRAFTISTKSSVKPRSSPPKRSFDVAFLTGVKETLPDEELEKEEPERATKVSKGIGFPQTNSSERTSETEEQSRSSRTSRFLHTEDRGSGSAFTKVFKSHTTSLSPPSRSSAFDIASSLSSAAWPQPHTSFTAMSSLLSGTKSLSPLIGNPSFLPPVLMPLLSTTSATAADTLNNNLVEEYLKSRHELLISKSSASEALSRLRSTMIPHSEVYKLPFAGLTYALGGAAMAGGTNPPKSSPSPAFLPQNSVSALMPPSLSTMSLPAQNVCAKCNISFRMTSDLVYHMRSQHKREPDPYIKRRNEKLKCPICQESFRERHHLTRHMTAHQDRAEEVEPK